MKLNQLVYFCQACASGSISRAAEELHISQPTISMSIHELEDEFGVQLMQRNNKGFVLTEAGRVFNKQGLHILKQTQYLQDSMQDFNVHHTPIHLGIPPMIGTILFPPLYEGFHRAYPQIKLESREGGSQELLSLVDKGDLDFAIVTSNLVEHNAYKVLPLRETETVFCVSASHPLATKESLTIEEIKDLPLVMFHKGASQNALIQSRFAQAGYEPRIIFQTGQLYTIREFVRRNIAAAFLFRELSQSMPGICGIPLNDPIHVQIAIVWKDDHYLSKAARQFIQFAQPCLVP